MPRLRATTRKLEAVRQDRLRHPARVIYEPSSLIAGRRERALLVGSLFAGIAVVMLVDYCVSLWFDGQVALGAASVVLLGFILGMGAVLQRRSIALEAEHRVGIERLREGMEASARALEAEMRLRSRDGATVEIEVLEVVAARGWLVVASDGRRLVIFDCGAEGAVSLRGPLVDMRLPTDDTGILPRRWRVERLRDSGGILSLTAFGEPMALRPVELSTPAVLDRVSECCVTTLAGLPPEMQSLLGEMRTPYRAG